MGERIPLEDMRPASGVAQGIGEDDLSMVGKGIYRCGELCLPALRVAELPTSLIRETALLNSDPNIAITVSAGPCCTHVKQVTYNHKQLMSAPESNGLFVLPTNPPTVATPCRHSEPGWVDTCMSNAARATHGVTNACNHRHRRHTRL